MPIEDRYKQVLNQDLRGLATNTVRKFSFLLKSLGAEYVHGKLYDYALNHYEREKPYTNKFFGLPMWDRVVLDTETENDFNLVVDMVLIDVSMSKNIVKTSIQGLNGTVKEYIADGDYVINIKGCLFGEDNQYPEDEVRDLLEILQKPASIEVQSNFLEYFDINTIVVENYKLEAKQGNGNVQFFEINAVSDMPKELILSNNKENQPILMQESFIA